MLQGPTGTGKTLAMQIMKIYQTIDAARVKHNQICGVVEAALDDMATTDIVITNVTIHGILWGEPSNSLNVEEIIGTSLPSLKVIYEK